MADNRNFITHVVALVTCAGDTKIRTAFKRHFKIAKQAVKAEMRRHRVLHTKPVLRDTALNNPVSRKFLNFAKIFTWVQSAAALWPPAEARMIN
jgi:hypothetical protein